jgi:hypothetical protein
MQVTYIWRQSLTIFWFFVMDIANQNLYSSNYWHIIYTYFSATIFATIASVGVHLGVPLSLGRIFSENRLQDARAFIYSSSLIVSIGLIASTFLVFVIRNFYYNQFSANLLIFSISLAGFTAIANYTDSVSSYHMNPSQPISLTLTAIAKS